MRRRERDELGYIIRKYLKSLFFKPSQREERTFKLAEKLTKLLVPNYIFSENFLYWREDEEFLSKYRSLCPNDRSADRKFFLRSLLNLIEHVAGDTVECGVLEGCSSYFICRKIQGTGRHHHVFDSWEGLSQPGKLDGAHWMPGALNASEEVTRQTLQEFNFVRFYKGWIPERFKEVAEKRFSFVHIDVDLYEPTKQSLEFFYPRVETGGIIICDDYGSTLCPGAYQACNEFFDSTREKLVHAPTGQGFVIKL